MKGYCEESDRNLECDEFLPASLLLISPFEDFSGNNGVQVSNIQPQNVFSEPQWPISGNWH